MDGKRIHVFLCLSPLHMSLLLIVTKYMTTTQIQWSTEATVILYLVRLKEIYSTIF